MGQLTYTQLNTLGDQLCKNYMALYGSTGYGIGNASGGVVKGMADIRDIVNGLNDATFRDADLQALFSSIAVQEVAKNTLKNVGATILTNWFNAISSACAQYGSYNNISTVSDIQTFMQYFNYGSGGNNLSLQAPWWRDLYYAVRSAYPDPKCVYFECLEGGSFQGTTFTNGLAKYDKATATLTDGYTIVYTNYAGGLPYIKWSGGSGSGACTITVAGKNQDNLAVNYTLTGTWADSNFNATNTGVALTPSIANSLITDVTSVTVTGMTAGTFYIESHRPAGRSAIVPPT